LAHRDYFLSGSAIYVDLFKNRLVISSPGSFFGTGDMKKHISWIHSFQKEEMN